MTVFLAKVNGFVALLGCWVVMLNAKVRRLIGGLLFILFLAFYVVLVIAVSYGILPGKSQGFQLIFMAIAGTIWVIPGAWIIKWLAK